ncbi:Mth938-like domain-containing protein [Luteimonas suaedae]|uniref:Mth938-like domain-containing protein n=1 Tax=Luteimonas suaedae TaxID=2605430 RepID=UPI0011EE9720|nr:Mth938-like domain-containing protein [Luteimonas suaedae]
MQFNLEKLDFDYFLRGADAASALVNERQLRASFVIAPDALVEDWPVQDVTAMAPADLDPLLALSPEVVVLGTGDRQAFPPAEVMAACLSRGIGLESMTNAAAARTYQVLAGEGRRVVAGFVLEGRDSGAGTRNP